MSAPPRSELEWLAHDIAEFRRVLDAHPSWVAPLSDARDPVKHTRYHVVADLCWQIWFHVLGVGVLLEEELFAPLMVVQRALFEAMTTLDYLLRIRARKRRP